MINKHGYEPEKLYLSVHKSFCTNKMKILDLAALTPAFEADPEHALAVIYQAKQNLNSK
jgi:hypothetical protein